jgi:hypothetical protein
MYLFFFFFLMKRYASVTQLFIFLLPRTVSTSTMAHEKKKKKIMKKSVKFMAEGQGIKVLGASFMAEKGHNFFTRSIIKFLRVEGGHMPPPLQPPLPPPLNYIDFGAKCFCWSI